MTDTHPSLVQLEELIVAAEPERLGFQIGLSQQAIFLIGHIIAQWGQLQTLIDFEIEHRGRANVPEQIAKEIRHDKLKYLKRAAPHFLARARDGALAAYIDNLLRIKKHKITRDALAHGTFALQDNQGFDGVCVLYKGQKLHITSMELASAAQEIGQSSGFFFGFWKWVDAKPHHDMLKALLEGHS